MFKKGLSNRSSTVQEYVIFVKKSYTTKRKAPHSPPSWRSVWFSFIEDCCYLYYLSNCLLAAFAQIFALAESFVYMESHLSQTWTCKLNLFLPVLFRKHIYQTKNNALIHPRSLTSKYNVLLIKFRGLNHPECLCDKANTSAPPHVVTCCTSVDNANATLTPFLLIFYLFKGTSYLQQQKTT